MRITTWNVNSIKQRVGHLLAFLEEAKPDVVCLQELKCQEDAFPRSEIEAAGYAVEAVGQKAYNGVALLVRSPLTYDPATILRALPGDAADEQARYVEALVTGEGVAPVRVASIYLPNGNPVASEKYPYKLAFLERLRLHARARMRDETALVLAGDYNVIPEPEDAAEPAAWVDDALYLPATPRRIPVASGRGIDRCGSRLRPAPRALQLLGLSGRLLAAKLRHPHRSSAAVAAGRGPARVGVGSEASARPRKAVGSRAGHGRTHEPIGRSEAPCQRHGSSAASRRPAAIAPRKALVIRLVLVAVSAGPLGHRLAQIRVTVLPAIAGDRRRVPGAGMGAGQEGAIGPGEVQQRLAGHAGNRDLALHVLHLPHVERAVGDRGPAQQRITDPCSRRWP